MSPELQPGVTFEWQTTVPEKGLVPQSVSYTHLTLPTILRV